MTRIERFIRTLLTLVVAAGALLALPLSASADKLHLKDGRVLEGRVEKEEGQVVWFVVVVGKIEQRQLFTTDQILRIERDAAAPEAPVAGAARPEAARPAAAASGSATRVAVLNFGAPNAWQGKIEDMVGREISVKSWRDAIPLLEKDGVTVVVVRVNSGGGLGLEVGKFIDLFHNEYKKKFRTVAWIESAISAAAMSPYVLEEMYFMPEGNLGACTGWYGQLQAVKDLPLEQMLFQMEKASEMAGRFPGIMRSMQVLDAPLSYTIDKETGEVHWFQDTSGENVLNDGKHILTLNAVDAVKCRFARGIAATLDELMQQMGISEWVLAGQEASDLIDQTMIKADATTKHLQEMLVKYQIAVQAAQSLAGPDNKARRGAEVGRARNILNQIRAALRVNPNFEFLYNLPQEWFEEQERLLKRLLKD
jgi:hypothetical protein